MLRGNLRLLVLKLLCTKDMTGYDLMKSVKDRTGRKPSPGSMYPLLEELKASGKISVRELKRSRRYAITDAGRKELLEISSRKEELLANIRKSIGVFCTLTGTTEAECMSMLHQDQKKKEAKDKMQ